jgi:hypothetical protein
VQDGGEDRALDRERESAAGEKRLDDRPAAGLLPQPAEQQRRTDPPADQTIGVAASNLRQDQRPLGITGDRGGQPFQPAAGQHRVLAAEVLDDALFGAAILADALDQVEVSVAVDGLFADEHGDELASKYLARVKQQHASQRII